METEKIKVGMKKDASEEVVEGNTALAMGSGSLPVYATPAMTCLMEKAAAELAEECLPEEWTSVGIALDVQHKAATPVGMKVRAEAEVTAVEGRKIVFAVRAFDGKEEIGSGTHQRFAVLREKFLAKAQGKKG
ncbi:MAG: dihydrolipoamide acyltransferase [Selenomonadaceae bacterium]|nr:dihydrolipoamide acyltransferase [Selenomonadaceae bacterium]